MAFTLGLPISKKVRAASKLIQRGMPLRHVAQTVGLDYQLLRHLLAKQGVYKVPPPNRPWSEREVRILRRDYGKPGRSVHTIAAKLGRTCQSIDLKVALLGLNGPLEFRASMKGRTLKLSEHQQAKALRRLTVGESCRAVARTFGVHHATISRLAGWPPSVNRVWRTLSPPRMTAQAGRCSDAKKIFPSTPPITRVLLGTGLKGSGNSATGCAFGLVVPLSSPIRGMAAAALTLSNPP